VKKTNIVKYRSKNSRDALFYRKMNFNANR
jgi:hypothetical protein